MRSLVRYAYGNARMRAFVSRLLDERTYERLLSAKDAPSFLEALRGTACEGMPLESFSRECLRQAEEWLRQREHEEIENVVAGYPAGRERDVLQYVVEEENLGELKTALRVWRETRETGRAPALSAPERFQGLAQCADRECLLRSSALKEYFTEEEDAAHLPWFVIEARLDREFLGAMMRRVARLAPSDRTAAGKILGIEIDRRNLRLIGRALRFYPDRRQELFGFLCSGGLVLTDEVIGQLRASASPEEVLARVNRPYGNLAQIVRLPSEEMERAVDVFLLAQVRRALAGYPFSIGGPLGFVILRRRQTARLGRILAEKVGQAEGERARSGAAC